MARQLTVPLPGGREVVANDTGVDDGSVLAVVWHHGSPQTGALLEPLLEAGALRRVRLVSYGRPSYGGSTPQPGRTVGAAAADVLAITTELGIERFAVMGASGGGPHALACAALLPERVSAAATFASPAPFTREFDWFAGMVAPGGLRSASEGGREGRAAFAETDEFDERQFVDVDWQTLDGAWRALGQDAAAAAQASPDGLIDDDVAFVRPWGFELDRVHAPVLLVQGDADRVVPPSHARWLADHLPDAELWLRSGDGHVSVLEAVPAAMDWLIARSAPA